MTKKQLKIFLILFIFCILGVSIFYLWDKGEQKETENQAVLNLEEISLVLLNSHSSPQAGGNWTVSFETKGKADLTITPDDPGTINHLDFISLTCDKEEQTAQILDHDVIFYPNWSCEGVGKVTHLVNIAGHHTLFFQFGNQTAYAYNNPDSVTDSFTDESKIATSTNISVSGGQVKLEIFDPCYGTTTVQDASGTSYSIVAIGNQCWMAENLNIGTRIDGANEQENDSQIEKYCYEDSEANCDTDGGFYQWPEAMDLPSSCISTDCSGQVQSPHQGICPSGWHIPTDSEWTTLTDYLSADSQYWCGGNSTYIAKSLASTDAVQPNWTTSTTACQVGNDRATNNTTGFTCLPAGYRDTGGVFYNRAKYSCLWSTLQDSATNAWYRRLYYLSATVVRDGGSKTFGFSVRCLRD